MSKKLFVVAFAATIVIPLVVRADYTFTGPGLFTDTTKWSSHLLPTNTVDQNIRMKGLCGATNVAERLEGGKWCHIGYGGSSSWLDVKDCDFYFADLRIACGGYDGVYTHDGGSVWLSKGASIGYEANYADARMELTGVAVTNGSSTVINVGYKMPKDGGAALLKMTDCTFVNNSTLHVLNGGRAVFKGCDISKAGLFRVSKGSIAIIDSSLYGTSTGTFYPGYQNTSGLSTIALTNTTAYVGEKIYLGGVAGATAVFDLCESTYTNKYQVYIGNAAGSTGTIHVAKSTVNFQNSVVVGQGVSSHGELIFEGADNTLEKIGNVYVAESSNSTGRVVFDGVDWTKCKITSYYAIARGTNSVGRVEYRDIGGTNAYPLATVSSANNTNGYAETVFDNAHFSNSGSAYFGQGNREARVVVCNGSTFDLVRSGDIWIPDAAGSRVSFSVTNSPMFRIQPTGGSLKHEKANAELHFTFHDSTAYICTNRTFRMAEGSGSKASIAVSGNTELTAGTIMCFAAGESTFGLFGGTFTLGSVSGGSPTFNFDGGTLQSKAAQSAWFPATSTNYVCDGGAVFDARHNVTIPGVLRHGGTSAKDGGICKKGAATLTLSSATAHEFTGDIVVEEGTLVATALSNWTLAAGQKIGGAGTLKVGSGFTAGGVRFDAAWEGGLTVDGDVAFAPGSTLDVTGIDKDTEGSRFTILTADSLSGAENISATGAPGKWKLRASATSLSIVKDTGFILLVR